MTSRPHRLVWLVLAVIVLAGGALRFAAADRPGHRLFPDEQAYGRLATYLVATGDYGDPALGDRTRWAPGAPVAFAAADVVLPERTVRQRAEVPAARTFQAAAGTLTLLAAFGVAALLAGPVAGLLAAALLAFYPALISVVRYQISEPPAALLVVLGILALAAGRRRRPLACAAAGGALLGLAVLTRADLLVPVLLAGPALWLGVRGREGRRQFLAMTAATLVVIVPWSAFASVNRGRLVPVSGGGPGTLFMGTFLPGEGSVAGVKRELAAETQARYPDLRGRSAWQLPASRVLDAVAARRPGETRDAALMAESMANVRRYALGDPLDYAVMSVRKVVRLWSRPFQTSAPGLIAVHLALVAVGLAGLVVGVARREPVAVVLTAMIALSTLDNMVLVPEPRHNMPLMPALVAVGVGGLAGVLQRRRSPATETHRRADRAHRDPIRS